MLGADIILTQTILGLAGIKFSGLDKATKRFVEKMEERYGPADKVGKGFILNFGNQITCLIRYSKVYHENSAWYAIEQDFLDGKFKRNFSSPLGIFGIFLWGSDDTAFVLPQLVLHDQMHNSLSNRLHIEKKNNDFYLRTSGQQLLKITDLLNNLPIPKEDVVEVEQKTVKIETVTSQEQNLREHSKIQYLLIKFGRAAGYEVWVAPQDKTQKYNKEVFSEITLSELPNFGFDLNTKKIIENIDVLWIERNIIHKAFEIESTTNVYSGLLRLLDLILSQPNTNVDLNIVAPLSRRELVKKNILRPTFQNLRKRCSYISFEEISKKYEIAKEVLQLQAELRISLESEKF
ncbi:MAG: hypothetical protein ACHQQQ_12720 [Bacteroidota bacterium]